MIDTVPVLIAGGGPAGMATAIILISRGIPCIIVEPVVELKPKAGETIPPNAKQILKKLGLDALLQAQEHLPCYGNKFMWGALGKRDFFLNINGHGWHLNRMHFERQLRAHVQKVGVRWLLGYRTIDCKQIDNAWQVILHDKNDTAWKFNCNFLVDATGRASRIARTFGIQRKRLDRLTSLWCLVDTVDQVKPFYTFIEAVADGWWYAAPLQNKKLSLAFMTDSDMLNANMQSSKVYLEAARNLLLINPLVKKVSGMQFQPKIQPASTSYISIRVGKSWLAVGDAAYAYDPISSYGIASSLESGFFAGHTIADYFAGKEDALPNYDFLISASFSNYLKMHTQQYLQESRWSSEPFWKRRADK